QSELPSGAVGSRPGKRAGALGEKQMSKSHAPGASRAIVAIALSLVVFAGACQPDPVGSGSNPRLDNVDPNLTDPDIPSDAARPQFSIRPSSSPRNRLAVLFNGTGGVPSSLTT